MQRIDALCSDIWSEHGDAIGTYAPYLHCISLVQRCTYDKHTYSALTPLSPLTSSISSIVLRKLSFHHFTSLSDTESSGTFFLQKLQYITSHHFLKYLFNMSKKRSNKKEFRCILLWYYRITRFSSALCTLCVVAPP